MPAPTLSAQGATNANTSGSLTVTLPAHAANDILLLCLGYWGPNTSPTVDVIPTPSGWTKITSSDGVDGGAAWFFLRAASSSETNPVCTRGANWDTGTDTCFGGRAYTISGCGTSGNPYEATGLSSQYTTANQNFAAVTVSGANRLVVQFLVSLDNQANGSVSGWTAGTDDNDPTGTDCDFQTWRKDDVSSSTSADASNVDAPAQGGYVFLGISFVPLINGTLSSTLGALTLSSAGTTEVFGAFDKTLDALTLVSEGTVESLGVNGALDVTLGALTLASAGVEDVFGQLGWSQVADLERNALTDFSSTSGSGLAVSAAAALAGNYGMEITAAPAASSYGVLSAVANMDDVVIEFMIDPNSITMANDDDFVICYGMGSGAGGIALKAILYFSTTFGYALQAGLYSDTPSSHSSTLKFVTDAPHTVRLEWRKASAPGSNNGILNFYIDGVLRQTISGIDNDGHDVDSVRFGAVDQVDAGTAGVFYMDDMRFLDGWANLDALTLVSEGVVSGPVGEANITLGDLTLSATGMVEVQGAEGGTLEPLTLSSAGMVEVQGSLSQTLGPLTMSATAVADTLIVANILLGPLTMFSNDHYEGGLIAPAIHRMMKASAKPQLIAKGISKIFRATAHKDG